MDRRTFLGSAAVAAAALASQQSLSAVSRKTEAPPSDGLRIRFLGTGAADWKGPDQRGELRRWSSVLADGAFLIDFTSSARDMLPDGVRPEIIFYTHSHSDHYDPLAALEASGISYAFSL